MTPETCEWVSSSEASARLRVSKKTIWRRAKAGTLIGRKVPGEKGGFEWEIAFDSSGQPTDRPDKTERTATGQTDSKRANSSVKPTGQSDRPTDQRATGQTDSSDARLLTHLEEENRFLRAQLEKRTLEVEQHQRAEAELRLLLRRAQDGAPKQLTSGDSSTNNAPAQETVRNSQNEPQTVPMDNDNQNIPKAREFNPFDLPEGVSIFAALAEDIERKMSR